MKMSMTMASPFSTPVRCKKGMSNLKLYWIHSMTLNSPFVPIPANQWKDQNSVKAKFMSHHGKLHLFILAPIYLLFGIRRAVWIANTSIDAFRGYSWDIKCITLHAISRDPTAFPVPCLYCQVYRLLQNNTHPSISSIIQIEAENATEMRFVPSQSEDCTQIH